MKKKIEKKKIEKKKMKKKMKKELNKRLEEQVRATRKTELRPCSVGTFECWKHLKKS